MEDGCLLENPESIQPASLEDDLASGALPRVKPPAQTRLARLPRLWPVRQVNQQVKQSTWLPIIMLPSYDSLCLPLANHH